jgi:lipopolysaccharide biosynthesis protein
VVVVAPRDSWVRRLRPPADLPDGILVLTRPNVGYDFGSWRDAFATVDGLSGRGLVVLTNDSLLGPLGALDDLTARIEQIDADVWAATESHARGRHLQSYLLAFRGGSLERLLDFFGGVRALDSKEDVIANYERGLTRAIDAAGLRTHVEWPNDALGLPPDADPSMWGAAPLVELGLPFVKRSLRDQPTLRAQWQAAVAAAGRVHGVALR